MVVQATNTWGRLRSSGTTHHLIHHLSSIDSVCEITLIRKRNQLSSQKVQISNIFHIICQISQSVTFLCSCIMIISCQKTQLYPLPLYSKEIGHQWNSEVYESWNIFWKFLWYWIRKSGILLIYNHKYFVVYIVRILPICHIESPYSISSGAIANTYCSKFFKCSICTKCQLIWRSILEELINVICCFTNRICHRTLHLYNLSRCYIIESRHF